MPSSPSGKRKTGRTWAIVVIIGFAAFTGFNAFKLLTPQKEPPQEAAAVPVEVFRVRKQKMEDRLELIGNIQPAVSVNVFSKVPGQIIESITVEKGDAVRKGDIVATLQRDVIDAQLAEARAGLAAASAGRAQAQARLDVLKKDRQRLENLFAEKAVARQQVDHIQAEFTATKQSIRLADAQENRARAMISQLKVQSENHTIRAPTDGVVAVRHVDPGTLAAPGVPIISITDEKTIKVVFPVTEKDLPRIRQGMAVQVRLDAFADTVFDGSVDLISPTVDPATRSADVEVHIANPDGRLAPGMYARVSILIGTRTCLVMPADGIVRVPGTSERFVFVVDGGHAVQRNITTGLTAGTRVEIVDGVSVGESVVVKGQGRLKDGSPVRIIDAPANTAS